MRPLRTHARTHAGTSGFLEGFAPINEAFKCTTNLAWSGPAVAGGGNLSGVRGDPARLRYIDAAASVSVELCAEAGFAT